MTHVHVTPYPCSACPLRCDRAASPIQRAQLKAATTAGQPYRCRTMDPGPDGRLRLCAGWLTVAWRGSRWVIAAVQEARLVLADLRPDPGWPELHTSVDQVVEVTAPRQKRRRLRAPFRARS